MKVLLIAQSYPPYPASGSRRARNLVKAMCGAGHQVHVITERVDSDKGRIRESQRGLTVETVKSLPTALQVYGGIVTWVRKLVKNAEREPAREAEVEDTGASPGERPEELPGWKHALLSFLTLPETSGGFALPAVIRGLQRCRDDPDVIYTTAPPRYSALVGLVLKVVTGRTWVAEFRDPWIVNGEPHRSMYRSTLSDLIERRMEAACFERADTVITVTESHLKLLETRQHLPKPRRVALVRNGIPERVGKADSSSVSNRKESIRVVHLGKIYQGRSPVPFLEALSILHERQHLPDKGIAVEFIGAKTDKYQELVRNFDISELVTFEGWLPFPEAQSRLEQADLCLLLAQQQPYQVPNKLYEYLGTGKPILAFADEEGESAKMLREVGRHYLVTEKHSSTELLDIVASALHGDARCCLDPRVEDREQVLACWETDRQMGRLLELLEDPTETADWSAAGPPSMFSSVSDGP